MRISLIEGDEGCAYAVKNGCVALVVDALRASATTAALFDAGATEILVVREPEDAFAARAAYPDALLFGERGGLPPEGFDYGNSPLEAAAAAGRRVIFTTTTGAQRLVACWGAETVYMASTVNASAAIRAAFRHGKEVVIIPAGLANDPAFNAQEDWAAATAIAMRAVTVANVTRVPLLVGEGRAELCRWQARILEEGLLRLFETAPHAEKLRQVGLGNEIRYCARLDRTRAVPQAVCRNQFGVLMKNAAVGCLDSQGSCRNS